MPETSPTQSIALFLLNHPVDVTFDVPISVFVSFQVWDVPVWVVQFSDVTFQRRK